MCCVGHQSRSMLAVFCRCMHMYMYRYMYTCAGDDYSKLQEATAAVEKQKLAMQRLKVCL